MDNKEMEAIKLKAEIFDLQVAYGNIKKQMTDKISILNRLQCDEQTPERILQDNGVEG